MTKCAKLVLTGGLFGLITLGRHAYQKQLPAKRFAQLKHGLAQTHVVSGGFIDHRKHPINRGDVLGFGYAAGLEIDGQWWRFDLLVDGTALHWRQLDVKARD